ncbi:MAG: hypothetical protein U0491_00925 [Candidatus Saccharimonadales bacterium]
MKRFLPVSFVLAGFFMFYAVIVPVSAYAAPQPPADSATAAAQAAADATCGKKTTIFGIPTWYEYLDVVKTDTGCEIQTKPADGDGLKIIFLILLAITDILIRLSAVVAVGFVIYGGFSFVVSQGEPNKIVSARKTILNAIIGLVIALLASQIVRFVASFLSKQVS